MDGLRQEATAGIPSSEPTGGPDGLLMVPASMEDLEDLVALELKSFSAPWTRKMFEGELSGNPFARFLLLREVGRGRPGELVASLCYWIVFDELRVMNLAVAPERRRHGLATTLVRQAIRDAQQAEVARALLEVRASNEAARGLYRELGFREQGCRRNYYTNPAEDAVLMVLEPLRQTQAG